MSGRQIEGYKIKDVMDKGKINNKAYNTQNIRGAGPLINITGGKARYTAAG